jgi:hypothetical protein
MEQDNSSKQRAPLLWDPRAVMKFWFDAWSQAMDGYLRSAAFLRLMQQGFGVQETASERKADR